MRLIASKPRTPWCEVECRRGCEQAEADAFLETRLRGLRRRLPSFSQPNLQSLHRCFNHLL